MDLHFALFAPPHTHRAPANIVLVAADTWHPIPETCLPLFSSTSPDGPSFLRCLPLHTPTAHRRTSCPQPADTWHPIPETCFPLFSSTSPDEPSFLRGLPRQVPTRGRLARRMQLLRPGPRDLKLALLCFHRYSRMHLHFSLFSRPIAHSATLNTPDGERPTLGTRHLKPAFPCFHQHLRMNLHFALFAPPHTHRAPANIVPAAR